MTCERCNGSGEIGVRSATGRGEAPGPVPEDARGWTECACPDCLGAGFINKDEDEQEEDNDERS